MPAQTELRMDVDAANEIITISSKGPLDLRAVAIVVPFGAITAAYLAVLTHQVQAAARRVGGIQPATGDQKQAIRS